MGLRAGRELVRFAAIGLGTALRRAYSLDDAERFLSQALGSMPGAPAKMAQILGMRSHRDIPAPQAMPPKLVKSIIETECPALADNLESISEWAHTASLGQTHQAVMKSGELLAIKVQYPGVAEQITAQIDAIFGVAGISPAKKYDFDSLSTKEFLSRKLLEETDYQSEAENQETFFRRYKDSAIVIPKVYRQFSSARVLVQSWENSSNLQTFSSMASHEQKVRAASMITAWLFDSMFGLTKIHTDLNPSNFGFRLSDDGLKFIVYDFGSVDDFSLDRAMGIYHWSIAAQNNELDQVKSSLNALGFSLKRLEPISGKLVPLSRELLKPLISHGLWVPGKWDLKKSLEDILGQDKWWFRTAGPPWFLYFMRSVQGWHHALEILDCEVDLHSLWHPWAENLRVLSRAASTERLSSSKTRIEEDILTKAPNASGSLRVKVDEGSEMIVDMTLPVAAVHDLEELLPEHVQQKCHADGIKLDEIRERAVKSGLIPQDLFVTHYGSRTCKVWLE